jgi:hypothetical protein
VALLQELVDTSGNGRPSLFGIDSVHQMETSLSLLDVNHLLVGTGLKAWPHRPGCSSRGASTPPEDRPCGRQVCALLVY